MFVKLDILLANFQWNSVVSRQNSLFSTNQSATSLPNLEY